jgi:hypothetical protein
MKITGEEEEVILHNFLCDLRKKELNPRQKAELISSYMAEKNVSAREFGRRWNVPHSTVDDWLRILEMPEDEYNELLSNGVTPTQVYRGLRNNINRKEALGAEPAIDKELKRAMGTFSFFKLKPPHSKQTERLIDGLISLLEKIKQVI